MTIIPRPRRGKNIRTAVAERPEPGPSQDARWNFDDIVDLARGLGYRMPSPSPEHEAGW
jgi:hypothetical protein